MATRTNHPTTPVPGGELARLLDVEGRLEEALASARADAEARLATATAETERQVAALDAEIAAAATALRGRIDAERAAREAEITATGEREAERFARVTDARIDTLARDLAVLLIEGMEQRP